MLRQAVLSLLSKTRASTAAASLRRPPRRWASDMPVPQSQTAPLWHGHDPTVTSEGWEVSLYFYYTLAVLLQGAIILAAPETSIEAWARSEAQARLLLQAQGQTEFEFGKHYQDTVEGQQADLWAKFAQRSMNPGDDDDDDDDDEEEEEEEED